MVKLNTTLGQITLELNTEKAPITVQNFLDYVTAGHYNDLIFHRVISGFMIQGGGHQADMSERKALSPIENEADNGLTNDKYTIAMARTNDPHSATAQFFINIADNGFLNHKAKTAQGWGYTVFGRVTAGEAVVDQIAAVETGQLGRHGDVPKQAVTIDNAEVVQE